jgi:hypothetical protein
MTRCRMILYAELGDSSLLAAATSGKDFGKAKTRTPKTAGYATRLTQ